MPTYRLDLAYDGTGFHGYASQPDVRTVQGDLEEALAVVLRSAATTTCAGRTDAGVHAYGQVISFVHPASVDVRRLRRSLNRMLAPDIVLYSAIEVADDFDARFSARWREYRYRVFCAPDPDPLVRNTVWHVPDPLDVEAMSKAVSSFVGDHDFASFCRRAEGRTTVRSVLDARWEVDGRIREMRIRATSFCHQMVRSIVGFCVDAGRGRADPAGVPEVIAARDRAAARPIAPPQGLVLWKVGYD